MLQTLAEAAHNSTADEAIATVVTEAASRWASEPHPEIPKTADSVAPPEPVCPIDQTELTFVDMATRIVPISREYGSPRWDHEENEPEEGSAYLICERGHTFSFPGFDDDDQLDLSNPLERIDA